MKITKVILILAVISLTVLVLTDDHKCVEVNTLEPLDTAPNVYAEPVRVAQLDGYTLSKEQLEMSDEDLAASLPVPQSFDDIWNLQETLYNEMRYDAYEHYRDLHRERLHAERATTQKAEMLQAVATFVKAGGVKMTTRIKVDPMAYAGLLSAAGAPEGTDLETGVVFDPEGDRVMINYGQPNTSPAVTVTYNITDMIEQMGDIMSMFDPEIQDEVTDTVTEWQATRKDIVERLAQQ